MPSGLITPSYKVGFASPQRGDLMYPELWRGCIGAWAPCLGATGLSLRDNSGRGKHGTLTNMDPATDWVARDGKIALDFDGSSDMVSIQTTPLSGSKTTAFWVRPSAAISAVLIGGNNGGYFPYISGGSIYVSDEIIGYSGPISDTTTTIGIWYHYCFSSNGTTVRVYKNGVDIGGLDNRNPTTINTIGAYASSSLSFNGAMDDIRFYNRALTPPEVSLLATRRGIAYELDRKRRAYVVGVGGGATVTPTTAALTLTTFAPTVTTPRTVTPSTASLTLTTFTPTVSTPQTVTPATASLTLTTFAPTVTAGGSQTVTPTPASLSLSTFAPTVSTPQTVTPTTAALTLNTFTPTVTTPRTVTPTPTALSVTTFAPTVSVGGSVSVTPTTLALTLTTFAPTITAGGTVNSLTIDFQGGGVASGPTAVAVSGGELSVTDADGPLAVNSTSN